MKLSLILMNLAAVAFIQAQKFNNPILSDKSYIDPGALKVNDTYYVVSYTTNVTDGIFPIHTSTDLMAWQLAGYVFDGSNVPTWVRNGTFRAPVIYQNGPNFTLYYAVYSYTGSFWDLAVATASHPLGPYLATDWPMLALPDQNTNYPAVIQDGENTSLVWSKFTTFINARRLNRDGLSFYTDTITTLLKPELQWEGGAVYYPSHFRRGSYHYLLYTGNTNCEKSGIGVARSSQASGPYERLSDPILASNSDYYCPRDATVVKDLDGINDVIIFNAFVNSSFIVVLASIGWEVDDWPYVEAKRL